MKREAKFGVGPIGSITGFKFLFLVLLVSIFLAGFFPGIAMRTSEIVRENPTNAVNLTRISLIGFVGFCTLGVSILRVEKLLGNIKGPIGWMIIYAVAALASAAYSSMPLVSAGKALEVLVDVLFFVAVNSFCTTLEIVSLWNFFLSVLIAYLGAVWISALIDPSGGFIHIPGAFLPLQLQGAFPSTSPNDLGEMSAIVTATAFYRVLVRPSLRVQNDRLLWGGVLLFGLASLIFAQARTSMVEVAVAFAVILFLTRKLSLLPILGLCGLALIAGGIGGTLVEYSLRGQNSAEFFGMTGRLKIWEVAWDFFKESPLFGHGFYTAHRLDLNIRLRSITSLDVSNIDNTYLEILLGVGIIGLLPLCVALFQLSRQFLWIARIADSGARIHQCRCEIVGALIIVLIRALDGPTFQDHTISLLVLLISMAFLYTSISQISARQRAKLRINQYYRSLVKA